jgi:hypothetical protein
MVIREIVACIIFERLDISKLHINCRGCNTHISVFNVHLQPDMFSLLSPVYND